MKHSIKFLNFVSICALLLPLKSWSGELKKDGDGDILWQAGINGVEIEWDNNGNFKRVYSQRCNPVRIPDREGINKASDIAEEFAKAAIVRFIEQNSFGSNLVSQVSSDSEKAVRTQTVGSDVVNSEISRQMSETLTRIVGSDFRGRLSGVVLLESGYDPKKQEACVRVGISLKTLGAANSLSNAINNRGQTQGQGGGQAPSQGSSSNLIQGSDVRKSNMKDW
jgi:hypothetical protein